MMQRALGVTLIAAALGASCSRSSGAATAPAPVSHTVTIEAMRFEPEKLNVNAGDTVVWVNKDMFPHTATSKAGGFDSGGIEAGKSWQYAATVPGEMTYVCTFHPTMKATLVIAAPARPARARR